MRIQIQISRPSLNMQNLLSEGGVGVMETKSLDGLTETNTVLQLASLIK